MAYDPKSRLPTFTFLVRASNDPLSSGWSSRAGTKGLKTAKRVGRGGRVTWVVWTDVAKLQVDQLPEQVGKVTVLEPTIGQMQIVSALRYTGLVLPR